MKKIIVSLLFGAGLMASVSSVSLAQSNNLVRSGNNVATPSRLDSIPYASTIGSPALTFFNGYFYLAHRGGTDSNTNIYITRCPANADVDCSIGANWQAEKIIGHNVISTTMAPALVVFDNKLYLVHRGEGKSNDNIYYTRCSSSDCTVSSNWGVDDGDFEKQIPGAAMEGRAALAVWNGRLYLAHRGGGDNHRIYYTYYDGNTWAQPESLLPGSDTTTQSPGLTVFNNTLYVVWKGENSNNNIYYTYLDGSQWAPWQQIPRGVQMLGSPALATDSDAGLLLVGYQDYPSGAFRLVKFNGENWSGSLWQGGDNMLNSPALTVPDDTTVVAPLGAFMGTTDHAVNVTTLLY